MIKEITSHYGVMGMLQGLRCKLNSGGRKKGAKLILVIKIVSYLNS